MAQAIRPAHPPFASFLGRGAHRPYGPQHRLVAGLMLIALGLTGLVPAHPASFRASLDATTIFANERATLSLILENAEPAVAPVPPPVAGLQFHSAGQSSEVGFVNGQRSSTLTYRYTVQAAGAGDYVIPPVRIRVGGQLLVTQPIELKVLPAELMAPTENAFLRLAVSRTNLFVGEVMPVEIRLYAVHGSLRDRPQLYQEGLTLARFDQRPVRSSVLGGRQFSLVIFETYVSPARAGHLTLGPASLPMTLPDPNAGVDLFGRPRRSIEVTLRSPSIQLIAHPLPEEGRPPDFRGAVGEFSMTVHVSTNVVAAGEPITLTIEVAGRGPIEPLQLPSFDHWTGFNVYPPAARVHTSDTFGIEGSKSFDQVIIPDSTYVTEIPPISFSYFNPESRAYRTVSHPATPITVAPRPAMAFVPSLLPSGTTTSHTDPGAPAILHIKARLDLQTATRPLLTQPWFIAVQGVPLLAWIGTMIWRRRRDQLEINPRHRRRRAVTNHVRQAIQQLQEHARRNEPDAFFVTLAHILKEQLGQLLDRPASAITEAALDEPIPLDPDLALKLRELFHLCDQHRFAPDRRVADLSSLLPAVTNTLRQLDRVEPTQPNLDPTMPAPAHPSASRLLLLALLVLTINWVPHALADADEQGAFLAANRLYEAGRFDDAIEAYLALRNQGIHSAALHFNLANAFLLSDQTGRAIFHYRVAQQLNPRDPDILANLQFARLQSGSPQIQTPPLWRRLLARLTLNEWTLLATLSFWAWLSLLSLRCVVPRFRRPSRPFVLFLSVSTCVTLFVLLTAWHEVRRPVAIVVVPEATVRFGPFDESKPHYTLPNGAEIQVRDQLDLWLEVVGPSGRVGWLHKDQVVRFHAADSIRRIL